MSRNREHVIALIVAVALVALALVLNVPKANSAVDPSGYDGDTRHCVTPREVWIIGPNTLTRRDVEIRWEMVDRGTFGVFPGMGDVWVYAMCDGDPRVAFLKVGNSGYVVAVGVFTP